MCHAFRRFAAPGPRFFIVLRPFSDSLDDFAARRLAAENPRLAMARTNRTIWEQKMEIEEAFNDFWQKYICHL